MQTILSTAAGALCVIGFVPYILAIIKGQTKPSKASWMIWAILDCITLAGMIAKGTVNGLAIGAIIGSGTVTVLSIRYGASGWSRLDLFCLSGAAAGIMLWWAFDEAVVGIVTSLAVISIGFAPTFVSAWKHPEHEDRLGWAIMFLSSAMMLAILPVWTIADAAQAFVFTIIEGIMLVLLWRPRSKKSGMVPATAQDSAA